MQKFWKFVFSMGGVITKVGGEISSYAMRRMFRPKGVTV